MDNTREKLLELLGQVQDFGIKRTHRLAHPKLPRNEEIADYLIAHGVTISQPTVTIRPDGIHELSQHQFVEEAVLRNATVQILRCKVCGETSIGWFRQDNTVEI